MMVVRQSQFIPSVRSGMVLVVVLVVVTVLTLAAYQYSQLMLNEHKATVSYQRTMQARALADSGVNYAAALLSDREAFTYILNGNPFDNPSAFQNQPVSLDFDGRFSVVSPLKPDEISSTATPFRYGVTDECGKLNLNALMRLDNSGKIAHDVLQKLFDNLPNMTNSEEVINSILDWIDSKDGPPRMFGAKNEYYLSLNPPYACKSGPLDTLEELLLVKGVTPQLLLGNDRNRNGMLDPEENDGSGVVDQGLSAYLTIYSREQNVDSQYQPRIYVNGSDLRQLYDRLSKTLGQEMASYIVAYRMYGPASLSSGKGKPQPESKPPSGAVSGGKPGSSNGDGKPGASTSSLGSGGQAAANQPLSSRLDFRRKAQRSIGSIYELINTQVSIPGPTPQTPPTRYPCPLNDLSQLRTLLPLLLDKVTTTRDTDIPARVNINTAPQAVLASLPGLSQADVQTILSLRPSPLSTTPPDPIFQTPAWLITEANFGVDKLRTLERYITARSQVYRMQVLGYQQVNGPTARIEAVIDTNGGRPRVLYWRDLTELGKGFMVQGEQRAVAP